MSQTMEIAALKLVEMVSKRDELQKERDRLRGEIEQQSTVISKCESELMSRVGKGRNPVVYVVGKTALIISHATIEIRDATVVDESTVLDRT